MESKIISVESLKYQTATMREVLREVKDHTKYSGIKVEAQLLSEEIELCSFAICSVMWYDLFCQIQHVIKRIQSPIVRVDVTVNLKKKRGMRNYRTIGFEAARTAATYVCEQMNVKAVLKLKRLKSQSDTSPMKLLLSP